uniref:Uncharacterized protein n=1 Tax=Anguilla anguilla TaxID=7936 RepID=A0A0E9Y2M0_ANGAN
MYQYRPLKTFLEASINSQLCLTTIFSCTSVICQCCKSINLQIHDQGVVSFCETFSTQYK